MYVVGIKKVNLDENLLEIETDEYKLNRCQRLHLHAQLLCNVKTFMAV